MGMPHINGRYSLAPYGHDVPCGHDVANPFEFHVSRRARDRYHFDAALFSSDGRVVLADFSAARRFAQQISVVRGAPVPASDINAMGLIDEIFHIVVRQYEMQNPGMMARA